MSSKSRASVAPVVEVPSWHPIALVALLLSVAITGNALSGRTVALVPSPGTSPIVHAYLPMLLVDWGLVLYVGRVGRPRFALTELIGLPEASARRAFVDLALALAIAVVIVAAETGWSLAVGPVRTASVQALLPGTPAERAVWGVVAVSTGLSEEIVYRGYLSRELSRWTRRPLAGLLGQAALFALAHGEQGPLAMLRCFVYAVGLGWVALRRGTLVPGIVAHIGLDLAAGLLH